MSALKSLWCCWHRQYFQPDGDWYAWESTLERTRRESLAVFDKWWDGCPGRWRQLRRRGVVKCIRVTVAPLAQTERGK